MNKKALIIIGLATLSLLRVATRTDITIGRVIDNEGNGKAYNGEAYYNYINYGCVQDAHENDIVLTVCLLNPFNQYEDDIVTRHDVILAHDTPEAITRQIVMNVTECDGDNTTLIDSDGNIWNYPLSNANVNDSYIVTLDTNRTDNVEDDEPVFFEKL